MDTTVTNDYTLIIIAVLNGMVGVITAVIAFYTARQSKRTELNTNSMKDALVKSTMDAAYAEGKEEARIAGEAKASTLARGRAEGALSGNPIQAAAPVAPIVAPGSVTGIITAPEKTVKTRKK